ncbi:MAG: alpha/beta hydrolase [Inquilinus sp.]|nr:alpha/beta hydrolase [Inquilinus sp.]
MTAIVFRDYDQAALDRQYNNRGRVPEAQAFLDRYVADSATARRAANVRLDVAYGQSPTERLDLFLPERRSGPAPVQIFFHGGYWKSLGKSEFSFVAPPFAAAGAIAAVVDYALIPAVDMDALVRQCRAAVAWLHDHIGEFGGDPERIFVSGHSAGGHLVGMLAATDWRAGFGVPADVVKGGVSLSGLFDLEPIRLSFLNADLGLTPDMARRNSPALLPPSPAVPLTLAYGSLESAEYHRQSALHAEHLERHGGHGALVPIADRHHFDIVLDLGDPRSEVFGLAAAQMGL